jgi:RNA polymerase sigma-70 factor (ECF subfamily)
VNAKATNTALRDVFNEHVVFVWRSLRFLGVAEADVEDLAQEVFAVVHRRLTEFEGRSTLRSWIYSICVRLVANHRRLARVRREVLLDVLPEPSQEAPEAPQEEMFAQQAALAELALLLQELDPGQRQVFVLYEVEELPMKEVAATIGCPLQTAYSRLHAARRALAQAMGAKAPQRRHA